MLSNFWCRWTTVEVLVREQEDRVRQGQPGCSLPMRWKTTVSIRVSTKKLGSTSKWKYTYVSASVCTWQKVPRYVDSESSWALKAWSETYRHSLKFAHLMIQPRPSPPSLIVMMMMMMMQGRPWSPGGRGSASRLAWTLFDWQAEVYPSLSSSLSH